MKFRVISTGGTIDKEYFDAISAYEVGPPQAGEVLLEANVGFRYEVEPVVAKDSLALTEADRVLIRERVQAAPERHILITHGTDTMTETARNLQDLADKVIVLTGAMQPARFRTSDAVFNLGCAVGALQLLPPGVYIAMNGQVAPAHCLTKNRSAGRFELKAERV